MGRQSRRPQRIKRVLYLEGNDRRRLKRIKRGEEPEDNSVEEELVKRDGEEKASLSDTLINGQGEHDLCFLCCSAFPTCPLDTGAEETLDNFIRKSEFYPAGGLSAEGLLALEGVSLCQSCLSQMSSAVAKQEEVLEVECQVQQLQRQLLRVMGKLREMVDAYLEQVGNLNIKISFSDDTPLKRRLGGGGDTKKIQSEERKVQEFRSGIVTGVQRLTLFRDDLSSNWKSADPENSPQPNSPALETDARSDPDSPDSPEEPDDTNDEDWEWENRSDNSVIGDNPPPVKAEPLSESENEADGTTESPAPSTKANNEPKNKKRMVSCPQCGKRVSYYYYPKHLNAGCKAPRRNSPHYCVQCNLAFRGALALARHNHKAHGVERPTSCATCGKAFKSIVGYRQHWCPLARSTEVPAHRAEVACEACGKLVTESHRRTHLLHWCPARSKEERQSVCDLCGAVLTNKLSFQQHWKLFHDPKRGTYSCDICGKTGFSTPANVRKHKRKHQQKVARSWMCERCGRDFNTSSHLRRHEKRCDGTKKPRKARECDMIKPMQEPATVDKGQGNEGGIQDNT